MRKMAVLVLVLFIIGLITSIIQTRNILDLGYLLVLLGFGIKLKKDSAKRYIQAALNHEYVSENGIELNEALPKMSPLNANYRNKKQQVFQKISTLVEKFKGIGGEI